MALPFDVRDLMKSGSRFMEERSQPVRIAVFVEVDAADPLINAVREQLRPFTAAATLQIEVAELGAAPLVVGGTDVVIALAGSGNAGLRQALSGPRQLRLPVVVVALGEPSGEHALSDALGQPTADIIMKPEPADAVESLGLWLSDNLSSKKLALAHNFAFMRKAVSEDAIRTTAIQNGLIGVVTPIPGADFPIMTANQIKMLLQIAAAYGQPLNAERVKELAAVVAGGYLFRALARQALTFVPVLGWAVKGGVAYTGTVAMGRAAIRYFEDGADLHQLTAYFATVRDKAVRSMPRRKQLAASTPEIAPAGYTSVSFETEATGAPTGTEGDGAGA